MSELISKDNLQLLDIAPPDYEDIAQSTASNHDIESPREPVVDSSPPQELTKGPRKLNFQKLATIIALLAVLSFIIFMCVQISRADAIFSHRCENIDGNTVYYGKTWLIFTLINGILVWITIVLEFVEEGLMALAMWGIYSLSELTVIFIITSAYDPFNAACFAIDSTFAFWMSLSLLKYIIIGAVASLAIIALIVVGLYALCKFLNPFE